MYKLKNTNGKVNALLRTGKDLVKTCLSVSAAQHIIDTGKMKKSNINGYPINVSDKWYFEGDIVIKKVESEEASKP